ncbi:transposase, partial [Neptuniibacter sp.]|uniref:transposase n=1 Tax=Neptuniibacter sp. TaxID=1962643 RepID=UPI002615E949
MTQGALPFKYEEEKQQSKMTAFGGLPVYLDLAQVLGLSRSMEEHLGVRKGSQGWSDSQIVMSLIMLNLAGGECVEDLNRLEKDEGFCRVIDRTHIDGMSRQQRRSLERRWRKEKRRSIPSPSAVLRYLSAFHDARQDRFREAGKAFIPASNIHLRGFSKVNSDFVSFIQKNNPQKTATLDMDATLVETNKSEALFCYKGYKSYQPFNTWWAEQEVVLHTEFRDGNVPAGFDQLRVLTEALECLPDGVDKVRLRSDTAGYQHNLLRYCALGSHKRFGKIEFAIGCDVTPEFKKAVAEVPEQDWHSYTKKVKGKEIETGKQWAEVCFVPNAIGHSKKGPEYRYIATREIIHEQLSLPGMEEEKTYPFPTMSKDNRKYKVFGIVTN